MTIHVLKSWTQFFKHIKEGRKTHELRKNDRGYKVGDTCQFQEYDITTGQYTGNECKAQITFLTDRQFPCAFSSAVLPADYCILSLKLIKDEQ